MENMKRYSSLRNRLKSSPMRRLYWALVRRDVLAANRREEHFYRSLLLGFQRNDLIFDIGANEGAKADTFLRLGGRVVAIEPDRTCQSILRDRFARRGATSKRISIVPKAASDKIGTEQLWVDGPGSAVNSMSRKWVEHLKEHKDSFRGGNWGLEFQTNSSVETTTISELITLYGIPYFIKIDVEGHELNVLAGMRQPVPFLSFEVNLCALRREGMECVMLLDGLQSGGYFNYSTDCSAGLALRNWLLAEDFCPVLNSCGDETVEVFWKSGCGFTRPQVRI